MDSYDVRFWDIKKLGTGTAARYRVRWAVDGRERCKSFKARPLADGFLDGLKDAARGRRPFSARTGLPEAETTEGEMVTWFEHARAYTEVKWPHLAPVSRRSVAEALVTVTTALTVKEPGAPEPTVLRRALFAWAFNPATREQVPPPEIAAALEWAERASLPVGGLEDTATVRLALAACARTLTGRRPGRRSGASGRCSTTRWATPSSRATCPPIRSTGSSGPPPPSRRAWTAASWSAPPRPGPCWPPSAGCPAGGSTWRRSTPACTTPRCGPRRRSCSARPTCTCRGRAGAGSTWPPPRPAGTAWTDQGTARQERGLKHRAAHETRTIPIPPDLVTLPRAHIKKYGTTPDGRIFQTARGGIIQDSAYSAVWADARTKALTPAQYRSPLGRRPYDLRHAAVSLWLNSGVPATEVARRAGHGVAVLLKIYAHCIDGQDGAANQRITDALTIPEADQDPGGEGGGDSQTAA